MSNTTKKQSKTHLRKNKENKNIEIFLKIINKIKIIYYLLILLH